jgi:uncharacterized membrane protein YcgQ (UPF0703/DUF1980 family)
VFCCLADAVAMAFVIKNGALEGITQGDWVKVYARLSAWTGKKMNLPQIKTKGAFFTAVNHDFLILADKVEKIDPPKLPFIFVVRTESPYTY